MYSQTNNNKVGLTTTNEKQSERVRSFVLRVLSEKNHASYSAKRSKAHGFTIVEMLVAMSIFTIVMTVSIGTLIAVIRAGAAAEENQALTAHISFVLDIMTRKIRTGYNYYCANDVEQGSYLYLSTNDCSNGASELAFTDGKTGNRVGYRFNATDNSIEQRIDEWEGGSTYTAGSWTAITSGTVVIEDLTFVLEDSTPGDDYQPRVRVLLQGTPSADQREDFSFHIQTTVASRSIDL